MLLIFLWTSAAEQKWQCSQPSPLRHPSPCEAGIVKSQPCWHKIPNWDYMNPAPKKNRWCPFQDGTTLLAPQENNRWNFGLCSTSPPQKKTPRNSPIDWPCEYERGRVGTHLSNATAAAPTVKGHRLLWSTWRLFLVEELFNRKTWFAPPPKKKIRKFTRSKVFQESKSPVVFVFSVVMSSICIKWVMIYILHI